MSVKNVILVLVGVFTAFNSKFVIEEIFSLLDTLNTSISTSTLPPVLIYLGLSLGVFVIVSFVFKVVE